MLELVTAQNLMIQSTILKIRQWPLNVIYAGTDNQHSNKNTKMIKKFAGPVLNIWITRPQSTNPKYLNETNNARY